MPDEQDYAALSNLLARPDSWSAAERRLVEFVLAQQRQAVADCHPKDRVRRSELSAVVAEIEAALARSRS